MYRMTPRPIIPALLAICIVFASATGNAFAHGGGGGGGGGHGGGGGGHSGGGHGGGHSRGSSGGGYVSAGTSYHGTGFFGASYPTWSAPTNAPSEAFFPEDLPGPRLLRFLTSHLPHLRQGA